MNTRSSILLVAIIFLVSMIVSAQETFSIVAIDTVTGEIGSAGASCIDGSIIINDIVPGKGAMNAQATVCVPNKNLQNGIGFIEMGQSAQVVLANALENDNCSFGDTTNRQYGVVTMPFIGLVFVASYTGSNCMDYKSHITGPNYSVQGNILAGQHVLDSIATRFERTQGDLACKLMAALQGANFPGADSRCLAEGTSSQSAFIRVAQPTDPADSFSLDLNVPSTPTGVEPIDSLQKLFDQVHNCNPPTSDNPMLHTRLDVKVYPVPSSNTLFFEIAGEIATPLMLKIKTVTGMDVLYSKINTQVFPFDIQNLSPGIYFYSISIKEEIVNRGKLLVQ